MCLRRPANFFAAGFAENPMVVVDSMRFPMLDATLCGRRNGRGHKSRWSCEGTCCCEHAADNGEYRVLGAALSAVPGRACRSGGVAHHGDCSSRPLDRDDSGRPALRVHRADRCSDDQHVAVKHCYRCDCRAPAGTLGIYYYDTSTSATPIVYYATQQVYHTLGWANEFAQGSNNTLAEDWDYFPFNDRDFTSVAELLLVPGCSPGLFTKQFVEFAPVRRLPRSSIR